MQEILEKLNDLIIEVKNKGVSLDLAMRNVEKQEALVGENLARQKQQDIVLKAREDAVKSKESALEILADAKKLKQDAIDLSAVILKDSKNLKVIQESVDKKSKETLELIDLYKRKLAAVDAKEIALAEEKKNLRKIILDEIKGKL